MSRMLRYCTATLTMGLLGVVTQVFAQDAYPTRPIRMLVPFPPGGSADTLTRIVTEEMSKTLGQPIVIENRPGAGGNLASSAVAKSEPDGYTLLSGSTTLPISASLFAKLNYDPMRDFKPITLIAQQPMLLVVNPKFEAKNVQDLIALARKEEGRLSYASAGYGSVNHLAVELLLLQASIAMTHVTYKGNSAAALDVVSGQVPIFVDFPLTGLPLIKDGKLRALATTNATRLKQLPDLPTVAESGLPGYQASLWFGFFAPAAVPDDIINKLNAAALEALSKPAVRARLEELGVEVIAAGPEQLAKDMKEDYARWKTVIEKAKIKVE